MPNLHLSFSSTPQKCIEVAASLLASELLHFKRRVNTLSELQEVQMFLLARITSWIRSKIHTKRVGVVTGFARFRSFAGTDCTIEMHVYACFVPFKMIHIRTFII